MKNKIIFGMGRKTLACFLTAVFILNFIQPGIISADAVPRNDTFTANSVNLDVDTFTIPMHLGDIKYSHKGGSEKIIIHIQDAHCNEYAQHKISDLIDYLNKEYGIEVINLEGGVGPYDLDVFTSMSGKAIRREVADYFVKSGEINGAEFYAINNPKSVLLWGIENKDLYIKNLQVYRDSLKYKKAVENSLDKLTYLLNNLKRHIFNADLLKIDIAYNTYKAGNKEFKDYLHFLVKRAKECAIQVRDYPDLYLLSQSMEKENEVDFNKANIERNILIDELKKTLSKNEARELVTKTIEFKTKKISRKVFYNYIYEKAKEVGVETKRFPQLSSYVVYVALYEAVDRYKVMGEMNELEAAIKEPFFENDTQRELNILSKTLALTKNIFAITLTKDDYKYYLDNADLFDVENYIRFIKREAPKYRITSEVSGDIYDLNGYLESIVKFYEYSFERDKAFLKNMRFKPGPGIRGPGSGEPEQPNAAIIVTGGFHTENLCELLEKNDFSYISILPKFINPNDYESPYFDLLAGQTTNLQSMLTSVIAKTAMMQIASHLNKILAEGVWGDDGVKAFDIAVRVIERMVETKSGVLTDGKDGPVITKLGKWENTPINIYDILSKILPGPEGTVSVPEKERIAEKEPVVKPSAEVVQVVDKLDKAMDFATHNFSVSNAYTEKYAVHKAIEKLEETRSEGGSIIVATAEPSGFSDLNNNWGHFNVDRVRDEFGRISGELLEEKKNDLKKIGVEFIGFYNPYGGRWHYLFSAGGTYGEEQNKEFEKILSDMLNDSMQKTVETAEDRFDIKTAKAFNMNLGISDLHREIRGLKDTQIKARENIEQKKMRDVYYEAMRLPDLFRMRLDQWKEHFETGPPEKIYETIMDEKNIGLRTAIGEVLGLGNGDIYDKETFGRIFRDYIRKQTDSEYFRDVLNEAINDSYSMIVYAENKYFVDVNKYLPRASREFRRGDLSRNIFNVPAPEGLINVFSRQTVPNADDWIRSAGKEGKLKEREVVRFIPDYKKYEKEIREIKERGTAPDVATINRMLKSIVNLRIQTRSEGVLQGIDVMNTLTRKFVSLAEENGGIVFRLDIDFDDLSVFSNINTEMADKIKIEGLRRISRIFKREFRERGFAATVQKGAGDESVVTGYFKGEQEELRGIVEKVIKEINGQLMDLEFGEKGRSEKISDMPEVKGKGVIPSISAGFDSVEIEQGSNIVFDNALRREIEKMNSRAEIANMYVKQAGKADVMFYMSGMIEDLKKAINQDTRIEVERYPMDQWVRIPYELIPYSDALREYFTDINAESEKSSESDVNVSRIPGTDEIGNKEFEDIKGKVYSAISLGKAEEYKINGEELDDANDWSGKMPGYDIGEILMDNVKVFSLDISDGKNGLLDYKDRIAALSYKGEKGELVIVLNSGLRPDGTYQRRDKDFYNNPEAMGQLIVHEYLESIFKTPEGKALSHGEIKNLEMKANGDNALTEFNKVLLTHMTLEQLKAIDKGHKTKEGYESDPEDKFYRAAQRWKIIYNLKKGLQNVRQGEYPTIQLIPQSPMQYLVDRSKLTSTGNDLKRVLSRRFGVNNYMIYYDDRATTQELKSEITKAITSIGNFDSDMARIVTFSNKENMPKFNRIFGEGGLNILNDKAHIVQGEFKVDNDNERFSAVTLAILGLELMEWDRKKEGDKSRSELANDIFELLISIGDYKGALEKLVDSKMPGGRPANLENLIKNILQGRFIVRIEKIDYEEMRDYMEAEAAVLKSL